MLSDEGSMGDQNLLLDLYILMMTKSPEERVSSTDAALLFAVDRFITKSSFDLLLCCGTSLSISKDGPSSMMTNSLVSWREQEEAFLVKGMAVVRVLY